MNCVTYYILLLIVLEISVLIFLEFIPTLSQIMCGIVNDNESRKGTQFNTIVISPIVTQTGIKPYRCEICQRKFTQLSHLQQHIRTHTGDKPYKCRHPNCNKAFSQLSNLQSHSRCHQTDKPYKCNSCYKCFQDEASLLDHIPKHKESKHLKTHICNFCGKSYTQETYLTKHMQKHVEKSEKRMARQNNNNNNSSNNNNNNHHQTNGKGKTSYFLFCFCFL